MSPSVSRNSVVSLLGTPQAVEGSLNDPVEREEFEIHYNEKWTYNNLASDPACVQHRVIYWHRYDFVATMIRANDDEHWRWDTKLIDAAQAVDARRERAHDHHPASPNNGRYRQVSQTENWRDLGGYVQDETTGRRIEKASP
jgi:hypothetical protein